MISRNTRLLLGGLLALVGAIALGNLLGMWSIPFFTKGWWTLLVIVPFLAEIIIKGIKLWSTMGLAIGILFLLAELNIFSIFSLSAVVFPLSIILLGLVFILYR